MFVPVLLKEVHGYARFSQVFEGNLGNRVAPRILIVSGTQKKNQPDLPGIIVSGIVKRSTVKGTTSDQKKGHYYALSIRPVPPFR
jgi:hypothetical protein